MEKVYYGTDAAQKWIIIELQVGVCVIVLNPPLHLEKGPEMSQTTDTFLHQQCIQFGCKSGDVIKCTQLRSILTLVIT